MPTLIAQVEDPTCQLPESARIILKVFICGLKSLDENIAVLDIEIARRSKEDPAARRLMTIPGVGPVTATAIVALAPAAETFRSGRDFAALARFDAAAEIDRRQTAAWCNLENERSRRKVPAAKLLERLLRGTNDTPFTYHWRQRCRAPSVHEGCAGRVLAGRDARTQAADAGDGCFGQQDSSRRVGGVVEGRGLQSSDRGGVSSSAIVGSSRA